MVGYQKAEAERLKRLEQGMSAMEKEELTEFRSAIMVRHLLETMKEEAKCNS